jgi:uncharacterized protein (UPF0335 family)
MSKANTAIFGGVSAAALRQYVTQIEQIDAEIKTLNEDKSEFYKAAKQAGADVHVLKWVIAERRKDPEKRRVMGALFGQYWTALHPPENSTPALDDGDARATTRTRDADLDPEAEEAA